MRHAGPGSVQFRDFRSRVICVSMRRPSLGLLLEFVVASYAKRVPGTGAARARARLGRLRYLTLCRGQAKNICAGYWLIQWIARSASIMVELIFPHILIIDGVSLTLPAAGQSLVSEGVTLDRLEPARKSTGRLKAQAMRCQSAPL